MNFRQAISVSMSKYAEFSGRSSRAEFGYFFLFGSIIGLITRVVDYNFMPEKMVPIYGGPVSVCITIALCPAHLGVTIRRLHDLGLSGWAYLTFPAPLLLSVIGVLVEPTKADPILVLSGILIILSLVFFCTIFFRKGTVGTNRFGDDPSDNHRTLDVSIAKVVMRTSP